MNYEKHLLAFCIPGETGSSIVITCQEKSQVKGLKLFAGGNCNLVIPKKAFKQMISRNELEVVEKVPNDIYKEFKAKWTENNNELDNESDVD